MMVEWANDVERRMVQLLNYVSVSVSVRARVRVCVRDTACVTCDFY